MNSLLKYGLTINLYRLPSLLKYIYFHVTASYEKQDAYIGNPNKGKNIRQKHTACANINSEGRAKEKSGVPYTIIDYSFEKFRFRCLF